MDNKQKIIDLLSTDDWDGIMKIVEEEKAKRKKQNLKVAEEGILGIKKGFVNWFLYSGSSYRYSSLREEFKNFNCQESYGELLHGDKFSITFAQTFVQNNTTLKNHRDRNEKAIYFYIKKIGKKYYVENSDGEKFKFEKLSELKANLRDKRIDSILND